MYGVRMWCNFHPQLCPEGRGSIVLVQKQSPARINKFGKMKGIKREGREQGGETRHESFPDPI